MADVVEALVYTPRHQEDEPQMPPSKIRTDLIAQYSSSHPDDVFDETDLENLFTEKFHEWNLPPSMKPHTFNQMLLTRCNLEKIQLRSKHYPSVILYSRKRAARPFAVALALHQSQPDPVPFPRNPSIGHFKTNNDAQRWPTYTKGLRSPF